MEYKTTILKVVNKLKFPKQTHRTPQVAPTVMAPGERAEGDVRDGS